jgi:hypothetical protein
MKAQDLRIGNNIFHRNKAITVNWQELKWIQEGNNNFQPIPITEDWLLKLGFEKTMSWTFAKELVGNNILVYYLGEKGFSIGFKNYSDFKCEHVHQLQNLYFTLTNEELIINL